MPKLMLPGSAVVPALLALTVPVMAGGRPRLTYQFTQGETYLYALTIVADRGDGIETSTGHVELAVKAVSGGEARITPSLQLTKSFQRKAGNFGPPRLPAPPSPPSFFGAREVVFDAHGNVLRSNGDSQLSYLLGEATQMIIEPLSPEGKNAWQRSTDLSIRQAQRFGPFPFKGPPGSETNIAARETIDFAIAAAPGEAVKITKKYELKTLTQAGATPRIHLQGAGEIIFDVKLGLPVKLDFKAALMQNEGNVSIRVPLTVTHRLLSAAEAVAYRKQLEETGPKRSKRLRKRLGSSRSLTPRSHKLSRTSSHRNSSRPVTRPTNSQSPFP